MSQISHVLAETPEIDLAVLAAEVEELEEYIVKGEVYRTLRVSTSTGVQQVQMSGGDLLTRFTAKLYAADTNTNVCPSIHVIGSFAVYFAARDIRRFRAKGWRLVSSADAAGSVRLVFEKP